jgi:hypothetical protein
MIMKSPSKKEISLMAKKIEVVTQVFYICSVCNREECPEFMRMVGQKLLKV